MFMSHAARTEERYMMQRNYYILMVKHWFDNIVQLSQYYQPFIDEGFVDLQSIQDVTMDDLMVMDINNPHHRKIILRHVAELKANCAKYQNPTQLMCSIPSISPMLSIACNPRYESPAITPSNRHTDDTEHVGINWSVLDLATRQTKETRQWQLNQPLINKMMRELRVEMDTLGDRAISQQSQQALSNYRSAVETGIAVTNASVALSVMRAECPDFMATRSYKMALNVLLSSLQSVARNAVDTASANQQAVLHEVKRLQAVGNRPQMELGGKEQEIDRVEKSKLDLIVNLSLEMEKMREIIKEQQIQLNKMKQ